MPRICKMLDRGSWDLPWGQEWIQRSGNGKNYSFKSNKFLFSFKGRNEPLKAVAQGGKIRVIYYESNRRGTSDWREVGGLGGYSDCSSER